MNVLLAEYRVSDILITPDKVVILSLKPKDPSQALQYVSGQYLSIGFRLHGRRTPMRSFSIVSSPSRGNTLQVAMRITGLFTRAASTIKIGDAAYIRGPYGKFVLDTKASKPVVMIAGGIGVTPMMSMIRWASDVASAVPITLLYSYRSGNKPAFYDELLELQAKNHNFRVTFFETSPKANTTAGKSTVFGQITPEYLQRITTNKYAGSSYYLCGPPAFMKAIETGLSGCGVGSNKIITESFSQSSSLIKSVASKTTLLTYAFTAGLLLLTIVIIAALDLIHSVPTTLHAQSGATALSVISHRLSESGLYYVVRGAGFTAAGLLILLMFSGIGQVTGMTYRYFEPVKAWMMHKALALSLCAAISLHIVSLLFDRHFDFSLTQVLVPLTNTYNNGTSVIGLFTDTSAVSVGILAMYFVAIIVASSLGWIDKHKRLWHWLHYLSYATISLVGLHALGTGTDLREGSYRVLWILSMAVVAAAIVTRIIRAGTLQNNHK